MNMQLTNSDALVGTVKGPGERPHEFLFITADNARARIGEFVYFTARDGTHERKILGNITARNLVRTLPDSFFADPNTPPSVVSSLIGLDDENCELYEITVETIGYFSKELKDFVNPRIPPDAGAPVFLASTETLAEVLSARQKGEPGAAHIGSLLTREAGEVPIVLSVKDVVSTHLAILASTGAGKSYTAGVFVEELLMPHNRAAVLIVDPHGEYDTLRAIEASDRFRSPDGYKPEVKIYTHNRIKIKFASLTEADIKYLLPEGTSEKMLHFFTQAFRRLKNSVRGERELYGYHDLRDAVLEQKYEGSERSESSNASSIDGLLWRMDSRFDATHKPNCIFSDSENIPLRELFKPGRCTILQLSDIEQNEQQVIVATLLRRANKSRMAAIRNEESGIARDDRLDYPIFALLEEAHRFAPAGQTVVSTNILKQILSEGRKFGVGIGLITQRPGKLDQDVLSQCMTQIIMRIVNPVDQDTIAKSVEGAGRGMLAELPALTKGQAVISGVGVNAPVMCRIRERLTKHGGETIDAPSEWMRWHSEAAQLHRAMDNSVLVSPKLEDKSEKFGVIDI